MWQIHNNISICVHTKYKECMNMYGKYNQFSHRKCVGLKIIGRGWDFTGRSENFWKTLFSLIITNYPIMTKSTRNAYYIFSKYIITTKRIQYQIYSCFIWRYKDVMGPDGIEYSFNPCESFTETNALAFVDNCHDVAVGHTRVLSSCTSLWSDVMASV